MHQVNSELLKMSKTILVYKVFQTAGHKIKYISQNFQKKTINSTEKSPRYMSLLLDLSFFSFYLNAIRYEYVV